MKLKKKNLKSFKKALIKRMNVVRTAKKKNILILKQTLHWRGTQQLVQRQTNIRRESNKCLDRKTHKTLLRAEDKFDGFIICEKKKIYWPNAKFLGSNLKASTKTTQPLIIILTAAREDGDGVWGEVEEWYVTNGMK